MPRHEFSGGCSGEHRAMIGIKACCFQHASDLA